MKHMKGILFLMAALTLFFIAMTTVNAQDDYYYEWDSYDDAAPWAFWGMFTGALCIIPVVMFILWIVLAIWVYKDAERRGSSGALWLVIVIITGILGLIIWLVVRPPIGGKQQMAPPPVQQQQYSDRRCPSCGRAIPNDARVCPYCGKNFDSQ